MYESHVPMSTSVFNSKNYDVCLKTEWTDVKITYLLVIAIVNKTAITTTLLLYGFITKFVAS